MNSEGRSWGGHLNEVFLEILHLYQVLHGGVICIRFRNLALSVVNNLTSLTIGATLGDLTSMEELVSFLLV